MPQMAAHHSPEATIRATRRPYTYALKPEFRATPLTEVRGQRGRSENHGSQVNAGIQVGASGLRRWAVRA